MGWYDFEDFFRPGAAAARGMAQPSQFGASHLQGQEVDIPMLHAGSQQSAAPIGPAPMTPGLPGPGLPEPELPGFTGLTPAQSTPEEHVAGGLGTFVPMPVSKTASGPKKTGMDTLTGIDEKSKKEIGSELSDWQDAVYGRAEEVEAAEMKSAQAGSEMVQQQLSDLRDEEADALEASKDAETRKESAYYKKIEIEKLRDKYVKQGVDPRKYWKDMPNGDRAMKMLAIAMEGLGKGLIRLGGGTPEAGSQVLKMIQASVDADIAAQKQKIADTMRAAGMAGADLDRMEKIYSKREGEARDIMTSRHKLELLQQAYNEKDPEVKKFMMGVVDKLGATGIKVAVDTADKYSKKRFSYASSPGAKAASGMTKGVSAEGVSKVRLAGAKDPTTHTEINGKWVKSPPGWVRYIYSQSKFDKDPRIARPGSFVVGGKKFTYGSVGTKIKDMKELTDEAKKPFVGLAADAHSLSEVLKGVVGQESWSATSKVKTWVSPSSAQMLHEALRGSVAIRKAVRDSGGRATDLENKITKGTLISPADSTPVANAKMKMFWKAVEDGLRKQVESHNWQTTDPAPVLGAWMEIQRLKKMFSGAAGGSGKTLKSIEKG